jgi:hypothetical protein
MHRMECTFTPPERLTVFVCPACREPTTFVDGHEPTTFYCSAFTPGQGPAHPPCVPVHYRLATEGTDDV